MSKFSAETKPQRQSFMRILKFSLLVFSLLIYQPACVRQIQSEQGNSGASARQISRRAVSLIRSAKRNLSRKERWRDLWYNAQDFGENRHLGEDWNKTTGGNTDCGEPVFAAADGRIVFAEDAGAGWGNVVIIEHAAADGTKIQSALRASGNDYENRRRGKKTRANRNHRQRKRALYVSSAF